MREAWSIQTVVIQTTEAQRLGYYHDSHLAQISLRKGPGEHVLHCEGLAIPRVSAKMLNCKLLSTAAAFVLYIL
jgi:hypothetical protein